MRPRSLISSGIQNRSKPRQIRIWFVFNPYRRVGKIRMTPHDMLNADQLRHTSDQYELRTSTKEVTMQAQDSFKNSTLPPGLCLWRMMKQASVHSFFPSVTPSSVTRLPQNDFLSVEDARWLVSASFCLQPDFRFGIQMHWLRT